MPVTLPAGVDKTENGAHPRSRPCASWPLATAHTRTIPGAAPSGTVSANRKLPSAATGDSARPNSWEASFHNTRTPVAPAMTWPLVMKALPAMPAAGDTMTTAAGTVAVAVAGGAWVRVGGALAGAVADGGAVAVAVALAVALDVAGIDAGGRAGG